MSLGGELLFAHMAGALGPVIYLSRSGQGSPLLDEVTQLWRLCVRPVGGFRRAGEIFAGLSVPTSVVNEPEQAAKLATGKRLLIDCVSEDVFALLGRGERISETGAAAVRVRGVFDGHLSDEFSQVWECNKGIERIYLRESLNSDFIRMFAEELRTGRIDEFDQFRAFFTQRKCRINSVRHRAHLAEAHFHPVIALDQPDDWQHDVALGEDRLVFAGDALCALILPQFAAAPAPFGCVVENLPEAAPNPRLRFDEFDEWKVQETRRKSRWIAVAYPVAKMPSVVVTFDIEAKGAPNAEVTELWSGLTRDRGDWEEWDEADAQLKLEESW
ncbi:MAG: hypothetical protein ACPGGK_12950 [Pikeienuella sp.]